MIMEADEEEEEREREREKAIDRQMIPDHAKRSITVHLFNSTVQLITRSLTSG
jgi:hypothetical protein